MYKVYVYIFPNGKKYVGCTSMDLAERRDCGYRNNLPLKSALRQYGWRGIEKKIVKDQLTKEEAFALEIATIKKYDTTNPHKGYNISYGGEATFKGLHHTKKTRKLMSELAKGRVVTDEARANMRAAHKDERKSVIRIDGEGVAIRFDSLGDAALGVGGYKSNISRACASGNRYKGYEWHFVERG